MKNTKSMKNMKNMKMVTKNKKKSTMMMAMMRMRKKTCMKTNWVNVLNGVSDVNDDDCVLTFSGCCVMTSFLFLCDQIS